MSAIEEMTPKSASAEITILRMTIRDLNTDYYVRNQSPVPDVEYDRMLRRLTVNDAKPRESGGGGGGGRYGSGGVVTAAVGTTPTTHFQIQTGETFQSISPVCLLLSLWTDRD